jgi:hypothetical protein
MQTNSFIFNQVNQVTHWIDGSVIYDTSDEFSGQLRTFRRGLLAFETGTDGGMIIPTDRSGGRCGPSIGKCFRAGNSYNFYIT